MIIHDDDVHVCDGGVCDDGVYVCCICLFGHLMVDCFSLEPHNNNNNNNNTLCGVVVQVPYECEISLQGWTPQPSGVIRIDITIHVGKVRSSNISILKLPTQ